MQALNYYPISLDEIEAKVAKKFKRNGTQKLEDNEPLDNVKEIVNEFGEKLYGLMEKFLLIYLSITKIGFCLLVMTNLV